VVQILPVCGVNAKSLSVYTGRLTGLPINIVVDNTLLLK